jgi:hypothetical protein
MPIGVRRLLYSMIALLGFAMMVPMAVSTRRLQAELGGDVLVPLDPMAFDPETSAWLMRLTLLFLVGLCIAAGFLYAAVSTGHPKPWKPRENGEPSCRRCGGAVSFGHGRCPTCDQQLVW